MVRSGWENAIVRAAYIERLGPPEEILSGELPEPVPGPTDVLVDVLATTVNPVDTFVRSGKWRTPIPFPFVVGRDLVGRVASEASGFAEGERVWCGSLGHGGRQGAAAQRAVVPADRLYRLPPTLSEEDGLEAVTVLHPAATAYLALFTHGRLRVGETVVVAGAGGNVGSAAVTLAAEAGARVVATAAARDEEYCRSLGAAEFADYRDPAALQRLCTGGVDIYVDTSGTNDLGVAVELLAFRGRIVLLAGLRSRPVLPVGELYLNDGTITGFVISKATTEELAGAARAINRLLAAGTLRAKAIEHLPLDAMAKAHTRLERGELHGRRLILTP